MIRTAVFATASIAAVWLAGAANAADRRVRVWRAPPPPAIIVWPVQDCSAFYNDFKRGIGWGSGVGVSAGLGTFEGALPRYPVNSFPNWYGDCLNWGNYSATGSVRR